MIFGINILTTPKSSDLYDWVAVNEAPIFVQCESVERLDEILHGENVMEFAKKHLQTPKLLENAIFCAREMDHPDQLIKIKLNK